VIVAEVERLHWRLWNGKAKVEALGIESPPLLDDPLPPSGFAPWEPWPPRAAQHLFMQRFRELAHGSRSSVPAPRTL